MRIPSKLNILLILSVISVLFFSKNSYAQLVILSSDYIPYSSVNNAPFDSYWLVHAYVTPQWNEVLITSNDPNFVDSKDGVTVKDTGKINAIINNVKCDIRLSNTKKDVPGTVDGTLYFYAVNTYDVGYLITNLEKASQLCREYTGSDPVWVGYYYDFPRYHLVCVYRYICDKCNYYRLYVPEDAQYEFQLHLEYSKPGTSETHILTLHVPDQVSVSDSYIEMVYLSKHLIEGHEDYCDADYLNNHFVFARDSIGRIRYTTANRFYSFIEEYKPQSLVKRINSETGAIYEFKDKDGVPVYKISEDDVNDIVNVITSINYKLSNLWLDVYKINSNAQIEFGNDIRFFSSPIEAEVRLLFNSQWLGIQRLNPVPEIISIHPESFVMNSYDSKSLSVTLRNKGSDGNVIIRIRNCKLAHLVSPTTVFVKGGSTKTFDITIQSGLVTKKNEGSCEVVICDPSEHFCDSKKISVTVLPVCRDECSPGRPYCEKNTVVECVWDSKLGCYRKQYMRCKIACNDGRCTDKPKTVCGNGICEYGETEQNCPVDCKGAVCGNGVCEPGENHDNCPIDCGGIGFKDKIIVYMFILILILIMIIKIIIRSRYV